MRTVRIIGEINEDAFSRFCTNMTLLEEVGSEDILIELCSAGGEEYVGLAFYGRIVNSPCNIIIKAYGQVLSAATVIFAAGDHRAMDAACWFMVHDSTDKVKGQVSGIKHHLKHMVRMENCWAELLAKHSKASKELWRELSLKETFISAQDLKELGLADEVLTGKGSP